METGLGSEADFLAILTGIVQLITAIGVLATAIASLVKAWQDRRRSGRNRD